MAKKGLSVILDKTGNFAKFNQILDKTGIFAKFDQTLDKTAITRNDKMERNTSLSNSRMTWFFNVEKRSGAKKHLFMLFLFFSICLSLMLRVFRVLEFV